MRLKILTSGHTVWPTEPLHYPFGVIPVGLVKTEKQEKGWFEQDDFDSILGEFPTTMPPFQELANKMDANIYANVMFVLLQLCDIKKC